MTTDLSPRFEAILKQLDTRKTQSPITSRLLRERALMAAFWEQITPTFEEYGKLRREVADLRLELLRHKTEHTHGFTPNKESDPVTGATVYLPYPPTANNLFPTGKNGRRFMSPKYKAWRDQAGWALAAQHPAPTRGPVAVTYDIRRIADRRRRDLGNMEKALSDLLVHAGVIEDDCLIEELTLRWVYDVPWEARATVRGVAP